jgi:glutamate racemase
MLKGGPDRAGQAEQIDTLLLGCTHYPLLRPLISGLVGDQVAIVDSATATASAVAEILAVNGLASPDDVEATHRQLTTGDADAFHALAARLFGSAFPEVEQIKLAVATR